MTYPNRGNPLKEYAAVNVYSAADSASPHRIVQMLMEGALERISAAKLALKERKIPEKATHVSRATDIILALQGALDHSVGSKVSETLDALYEYMCVQLVKANFENDAEKLDEVYKLLRTVKQGWDAVPDKFKNATHDELRSLVLGAQPPERTGT